ncbi:MAG: PLDc N-terminal domain-containing protein, partial [Tidjanibacter sp.]|nr:PLDc N-terminal domain-containing protein [Tidjanibacter sp.]
MIILQTILSVIYLSVALFTIVAIIHDRRDPVKTLAWILVICLIPIGGVVLYVAVGRNHRKEKLFNRKEIEDLVQIDSLCNTQLQYLANPEYNVGETIARNKSFITLLLNNNKSMLTLHNKVDILNNGQATFEALFEAIRSAKESIHLEYYIFEYDDIGSQMCKLLAERAAAGVEVRLIYDDVGSWSLKYKRVKQLRRQGIDVRRFMPVFFPWFSSKANYRNHR